MNFKAVISFLFCLTFLVTCKATPPDDITDPGQLLFLGYTKEKVNCARCHGDDGAGGNDAPDIRKVFAKHDEKKIIKIIRLGTGDENDDMPPFDQHLDQNELQAILNFLKSIQKDTLRLKR